MVTPEYLAGIAEPLQEIYSQLQGEIEADIARRIKRAGYVTDTAAWQAERLRQLVGSQQYINKRIAATLGISERELAGLFRAAGIKTSAKDEATRKAGVAAGVLQPGVPLTASPAFRQILEAGLRRTQGTLHNLTQTMALDASGKLVKYLDQAELMVQSGAFTTDQAIDRTVRQFTTDGVSAFDYASGVRTMVEAAVRRAVVTGINQAIAEVSLANAAELGTDLVEVSSHADARPEHALWQGKVYCIKGERGQYKNLATATGYGTGAGLCGWGCRHSFYAFVEGVSERLQHDAYSPRKYEAEQKQRYYERKVREWKRKAGTLRAGGVDATAAEEKVYLWQQRLREHTARHDLARMYQREKVWGPGSDVRGRRPRIKTITDPKPPEEKAAARAEATRAAKRQAPRPTPPAPPKPAPQPAPKPRVQAAAIQGPPTLAKFEATRDATLARKMASARPDPADVEQARKYVEASVAGAALRSRINQDVLRKVLADGKLKTQIELQAEHGKATSGGWLNPEGRKKTSSELFGTDVKTTPATDYEYYGYLWDDDPISDFKWDGTSQYGGSTLQLKQGLRERTTFTCGDSLGGWYAPSYVDQVTPCWDLNDSDRIAEWSQKSKPSMDGLTHGSRCGYVEAQYHGGVTLDDVEAFIIGPRDHRRNGIDKTLVGALNERGIRVGLTYFNDDGDLNFRWLTEEDWKL